MTILSSIVTRQVRTDTFESEVDAMFIDISAGLVTSFNRLTTAGCMKLSVLPLSIRACTPFPFTVICIDDRVNGIVAIVGPEIAVDTVGFL